MTLPTVCRSVLVLVAALTGWTCATPHGPSSVVLTHEHNPAATIKGPQPFPKLSPREQALWFARCRVGGEPFAVNHSFYGYYHRFLEQHPDWFAQGYPGKPPQLCFTNPALIRQVVQDARDYFDGKGLHGGAVAAGDYFAVVPMDGIQWCQCPRCRAELLAEPTQGQGQLACNIASDYVFGFVNKVARELRQTHPDKFIACLAYTNYSYPPQQVKLEPNVAVTLCLLDRLVFDRKLQENNRHILRAWAAESPARRKFLWLYLCYPAIVATRGEFRCFPGFYAHSLVNDLRQYHRYRIRGISFEPSYLADYYQSPLLDQLEAHLIWQLAEDPSRNGQQLIREFFTRYYGAAAEPMRHLDAAIEETYSNPTNYPAGLAVSEELAWGYLGTEDRMAGFARLMATARAAATTETERQRVALFEKGIWQYMQAGRAAFLEHARLRIPTMQQTRVPLLLPPVPGDARKVNWAAAAVLDHWRGLKGDATTRQVEARLAHDGEFLYVRLEERLDPKKLVRIADEVWDEDEWEMFFARQRARPYRQNGINAAGTHITLIQAEKSAPWDSGARVESATAAADRWQVLLALPLATLL
ncbi:MAG: DUF4838 domain-containing protein, partial [Acidobacteria bacterium]|nr:DUF4838 domain-containing protein [Acidobacteriota bacterium]